MLHSRKMLLGLLVLILAVPATPFADSYRRLLIITGAEPTTAETNYVSLFRSKMTERSGSLLITTKEEDESFSPEYYDLVLMVGYVGQHNLAESTLSSNGVALPTTSNPGTEGYKIKGLTYDGRPTVIILGVDARGMLYGIGHFLFRITYTSEIVFENGDVEGTAAPEKKFRARNLTDIDSMRQDMTGADGWSSAEMENYAKETWLYGYNGHLEGSGSVPRVTMSMAQNPPLPDTTYKNLDLATDFGMDYHNRTTANAIRSEDYQPEWNNNCDSPHPDRLVCPTDAGPAAVLSTIWEAYFQFAPQLESIGMPAGDPGGCPYGGCETWWENYIVHCESMAWLLDDYLPDAEFYVDTKQMDYAGIQNVLDWMVAHPDSHIDGFSWANQDDPYLPYGGQTDIFWPLSEHPIPWSRFFIELNEKLGDTYKIVMTADTTHWSQSQMAVFASDPIMKELYRRRALWTAPVWFKDIYMEIYPYWESYLTYSEGIHDDFNKYLWTRLSWDHTLSAESITEDYCHYFFGPDAKTDMVEAIFQFGENMRSRIQYNAAGVERFYNLVKNAEPQSPYDMNGKNWRWLMLRERGVIDLYYLRKIQAGQSVEDQAHQLLLQAKSAADPRTKVQEALALVDTYPTTTELANLRAEGEDLDDQLNTAIGYRFWEWYRVDTLDPVGIENLEFRLQQLLGSDPGGSPIDATYKESVLEEIDRIIYHKQALPEGYYVNCGTPGEQAHVRKGLLYYGKGGWSDPQAPETRSFNYTSHMQSELEYEFATNEAYRIRMKCTLPGGTNTAYWGQPVTQNIYAGDTLLGSVQINTAQVSEFEADIPDGVIQDNTLTIRVQNASGMGTAAVSEIWLYCKVLREPASVKISAMYQ